MFYNNLCHINYTVHQILKTLSRTISNYNDRNLFHLTMDIIILILNENKKIIQTWEY